VRCVSSIGQSLWRTPERFFPQVVLSKCGFPLSSCTIPEAVRRWTDAMMPACNRKAMPFSLGPAFDSAIGQARCFSTIVGCAKPHKGFPPLTHSKFFYVALSPFYWGTQFSVILPTKPVPAERNFSPRYFAWPPPHVEASRQFPRCRAPPFGPFGVVLFFSSLTRYPP